MVAISIAIDTIIIAIAIILDVCMPIAVGMIAIDASVIIFPPILTVFIVTSFCCILLTFSDIFGEVFYTVHDVNGRPLATVTGCWEPIRLGPCMCFQEIMLLFTTHAANVLCSLSTIARGGSDNAQRGD